MDGTARPQIESTRAQGCITARGDRRVAAGDWRLPVSGTPTLTALGVRPGDGREGPGGDVDVVLADRSGVARNRPEADAV